MRSSRKILSGTAAVAVVALISGMARGASFTPLGVLDGDVYSSAASISPDGSIIVGTSDHPATRGARVFIWDRVKGMRAIPQLWSDSGDFAVGMSADGSIVVGNGDNGAFIWDEAHGTRALALVVGQGDPVYSSVRHATGLSADGSTVIGRSESGAFVWNAERGIRDLGSLPTGRLPYPTGVSANGSIVVGQDMTDVGQTAFIWDSATGIRPLGDLPGGDELSAAIAVSDDGSRVVGVSSSAFGVEAFIWDAVNGMQGLGDLPGGVVLGHDIFISKATDLSADGSVVVGVGFADDGYKTFVWDPEHGMRDLEVLLTTMGVDLSGWRLNEFPDYSEFPKISEDGRTIVGIGVYNGQRRSYVAVIPEPSVALLLGAGLMALGSSGVRSPRARSCTFR